VRAWPCGRKVRKAIGFDSGVKDCMRYAEAAVVELFVQIFGFEQIFRCDGNRGRNEFVYVVHSFFYDSFYTYNLTLLLELALSLVCEKGPTMP
jgi:hypothetical protein